MTEQEWLSSNDPVAMLEWGQHHGFEMGQPLITKRQLRLFACACCRQVWDDLTDPRSRQAVEVAERFADGLATGEERSAAEREAYEAYRHFIPYYVPNLETCPNGKAVNAFAAAVNCVWYDDQSRAVIVQTREAGLSASTQAALLRDVAGNPWRLVRLEHAPDCPSWAGPKTITECGCIHPWLRWNNGTVLSLAREIYGGEADCPVCDTWGIETLHDERTGRTDHVKCLTCQGTGKVSRPFNAALMPYLGDALEDAGCTDQDILMHCRGFERCPVCQGNGRFCSGPCRGDGWVKLCGSHVKGCWVVDFVLGKD